MAEYNIVIQASIRAQNLDSANAKCDALKEKLGKDVEVVEVHLKGEK